MANLPEFMSDPNAEGRDGIHICAQLRIDSMQLYEHRIRWASDTMDKAANYIELLEQKLIRAIQPCDPTESTDTKPET